MQQSSLILPTGYLAPISYYVKMLNHTEVQIEQWEHYVKQTYRNRCIIATENGPLSLSVPVEKVLHGAPIRDVRISDHGNWRHQHWQALMTAYDRSPYFEYYADDFLPFYEQRYEFLLDFNEALRLKLCELMGITTAVRLTSSYKNLPPEEDERILMSPKNPQQEVEERMTPYFQVFRDKQGFLPNMSIIDLLFNMGPESILVLKKVEL